MHLRKLMHPRNKYKNKPDFKQLALLYPEFRKVIITEVSGKVRLNFKDDESLRILTKTLLKHDFALEVEIPPQKLIPAMSLRLNYILWIEDLLNHGGLTNMNSVHGIDVGTGAVCIYPLLFAKLYQCKMTASEIDPQSIESANNNVTRNNLQDLIKVISVSKETILSELLKEDENYTFVMTNPPFFKTDEDAKKQSKRLPPRNAPTGVESELEVEGGEVAFILKLIEDSIVSKSSVKIYTTMIGLKRSLIYLKSELIKRNIQNATWTEFCQGFTKRWGLAWSFLPKNILDLTTAPVIRMRSEILEKKKIEKPPSEIIFPPHGKYNSVEDVVTAVQICINDLNIESSELNLGDEKQSYWCRKLTAYEDSWSQARKRRRESLQIEISAKKSRLEEGNEIKARSSDSTFSLNSEGSPKIKNKEPFLVFILLIDSLKKIDKSQEENGTNIRISMMFESGTGSKSSLETFRQFLVNKLQVRKYFQQQFNSKKK